jgi:hypothetical protein
MMTPGLSRRELLQLTAAGVGAVSLSGWLNVLASRAAEQTSKHKSCILLWLDGGPSHKDTFDMKPGTANAGEFHPIKTSVPGIEISEHFPKLAPLMADVALVRGMSTGEGAHGRARYYMHTGYKEGVGGLSYPSLGSIVGSEIGDPTFPLPNFVSVGGRSYGSGFLGSRHAPIIVNDPTRGVESLKPLVDQKQFDNRVELLQELENAFYHDFQGGVGTDHQTTYNRAVTMMRSAQAKAFDISSEPAAARKAYGGTRFGDGCLLARRLVESGTAFVEVNLGGWDTHQDNFARVKTLSGQVDPAISALLSDLKQRGMLNDTLVLMMGEFGRTPKINARAPKVGRDHYPRAWSLLMAGGGVKGGQVVGKTDKEGAEVIERKTSALDFLATVCQLLRIDYNKQNNTPIGRPIRIVDKGANPIKELIG